MEFETLRREVILAIAADDYFWERLVLKGGNPLRIVHGIGARASLDVDYSIENDFENVEAVRARLERARAHHFRREHSIVIFDVTFEPRPRKPNADPRWGGYRAQFKVINRTKYNELAGDLDSLRRQADVIAPGQTRKFTDEISKYEFCAAQETRRTGPYDVVVYKIAAIAAEKLRALCQQRPDYATSGRSARARDFYDIHAMVTQGPLDIAAPENTAVLRHVFAAKNVPLELLVRLDEDREFHRVDWDSVRDSVAREPINNFDFYFDFVLAEVMRLKTLGVI